MSDDEVVLGAPLEQQSVAATSMLDGLGENTIVAIFNPLSHPFRVQYARTLASNTSKSDDRRKVEEKLGTTLDKDMNSSVGHAVQYHVLKAGQTENLPGDIAQLAVRQLVTYILFQRNKDKNSYMIADPHARSEVEKEIVIRIQDNVSFFNQQTTEEYTNKQIDELNPDKEPALNPPPGQGSTYEPSKA